MNILTTSSSQSMSVPASKHEVLSNRKLNAYKRPILIKSVKTHIIGMHEMLIKTNGVNFQAGK